MKKTTRRALQFYRQCWKMNGPEGACNTDSSPERQRTVGGSAMPPNGTDYSDSSPLGNREQPGNTWKSLGDLARALAERAAR